MLKLYCQHFCVQCCTCTQSDRYVEARRRELDSVLAKSTFCIAHIHNIHICTHSKAHLTKTRIPSINTRIYIYTMYLYKYEDALCYLSLSLVFLRWCQYLKTKKTKIIPFIGMIKSEDGMRQQRRMENDTNIHTYSYKQTNNSCERNIVKERYLIQSRKVCISTKYMNASYVYVFAISIFFRFIIVVWFAYFASDSEQKTLNWKFASVVYFWQWSGAKQQQQHHHHLNGSWPFSLHIQHGNVGHCCIGRCLL